MESSVTDPNLGFGLAFQLGAGLAFTHLWEWVMHMRAVPSFLPPSSLLCLPEGWPTSHGAWDG